MIHDESAQAHTIEGIAGGLIMILALIFVTSSVTFVSPQTEQSTDMKLGIMGQDILTVLNTGDRSHPSDLKQYVCSWNGGSADITSQLADEECIRQLNYSIYHLLPDSLNQSVQYNVIFRYNNGSCENTTMVICHGEPHEDSVTASKIVTVNEEDKDKYSSELWKDYDAPKVVEVRLELWYI